MMNFDFDDITIDSLSKFISKINKFRESRDGSNEELFFRGQSDNRWSLKPSLFRDSLVSVESRLIEAAMMLKPSEFSVNSSVVENLAKLQHYGLPTRLLDITSNPLVALYFACCDPIVNQSSQEDNYDTDTRDNSQDGIPLGGVVYLKSTYPTNYNEFKVSVASLIVTKRKFDNYTIKMLIDDVKRKLNYDYSIQEVKLLRNNIINVLQNNVCIVSPINNERLLRQNGAFIFCTNFLINEDRNDFINSTIQKAVGSLDESYFDEKLYIPENKKKTILAELDCHGINMQSLFPELDHQMHYLKNKFINTNTAPIINYEPIMAEEIYINRLELDYEINDQEDLIKLLKDCFNLNTREASNICLELEKYNDKFYDLNDEKIISTWRKIIKYRIRNQQAVNKNDEVKNIVDAYAKYVMEIHSGN